MSLFKYETFTGASGLEFDFKIECDALKDSDWECIAAVLYENLPRFGRIDYVPTGGMRLWRELLAYIDPDSNILLVVDDVWTTGKSWSEYVYHSYPGEYDATIGAVAFARGPYPSWIIPMFTLLDAYEIGEYER